jgi:hypothetical protein
VAYVREYRLKDGSRRFAARCLGADGKYHEEWGFTSRREAGRAAGKREVDAARGDWASSAASRITFKSYAEDDYWPTAAHLRCPPARPTATTWTSTSCPGLATCRCDGSGRR